jgi:hypothetical protein
MQYVECYVFFYCKGGWVGSRVGLDRCVKSRTHSTWSPLLPCFSRHAQSCYVILFRETVVVHRITYRFSYFFLVYFMFHLLILYLIQRKRVLYQVKSKSHFIQITQSLTLPHSALVRDCFPHSTPVSVIGYQPFSRFNSSRYHLSYLSPTVSERTLPDWTYASKPNNYTKIIGYYTSIRSPDRWAHSKSK